ncbi:unnamed protein product [Paramecium octaurelia]|uniref:Uncharacterized protein n=1 Tax=Paramecium octaurelia TaxID=43137 RepID=A0A8S1YRQ3_PAROT|nr:unnamed protein product [Paramecium octaurelia]
MGDVGYWQNIRPIKIFKLKVQTKIIKLFIQIPCN